VESVLFAIDRLSTWAGKLFAWAIVLLTFTVSYEVFMRYVMGRPTDWAYDGAYILYGALFIMAGAYTLSQNAHVRGDVVYRLWPVRVQASIDLVLYVLFFFPGVIALVYSGYGFAKLAWVVNERSSFSPAGPPLYHFKSLIPIAGALLFLQGIAEVARAAIALKTGQWPRRLHDVHEVEVPGRVGEGIAE
jgi:TRAP-type mannitol/chloroaromatic compound transport system permease small subunit